MPVPGGEDSREGIGAAGSVRVVGGMPELGRGCDNHRLAADAHRGVPFHASAF